MKKKIIKIITVCFFLLLMAITACVYLKAAIDSYRYDMDPANGVDILEGFGAVLNVMLGVFIILCETDLFFTVYYFLVKPKTLAKSVFMILSQLMITAVIFSEDLAKFLCRNVSNIFGDEMIIIIPTFFLYVVLRCICIFICFSKKGKASCINTTKKDPGSIT